MGDKELTAEQREALEREIERRIRAKAKRRVRIKLGFMWHLAVFFIVMMALVAINLTYSPEVLWVFWPLGAWGGALLLHGFATYSMAGITEDMIQAEIEREKRRRGLI
jgi:fatty acid desaturase